MIVTPSARALLVLLALSVCAGHSALGQTADEASAKFAADGESSSKAELKEAHALSDGRLRDRRENPLEQIDRKSTRLNSSH